MVACQAHNLTVGGSNPSSATKGPYLLIRALNCVFSPFVRCAALFSGPLKQSCSLQHVPLWSVFYEWTSRYLISETTVTLKEDSSSGSAVSDVPIPLRAEKNSGVCRVLTFSMTDCGTTVHKWYRIIDKGFRNWCR